MLEPWALAHKALKKKVAWHLYQKRILNRSAALHATSEREAENLRKLGLSSKIVTIPWGIEMPEEAHEKSEGLNVERSKGREAEEESEGLEVESRKSEDVDESVAVLALVSSDLTTLRPSDLATSSLLFSDPLSPIPDPRSSTSLPLHLDLKTLRPSDLPTSSLRRTALFVGRIYPVKGLPLLIEAWATVRPAG